MMPSVATDTLGWFLTDNPDAETARACWQDQPGSYCPVATGHRFDAVAMPIMLAEAVHTRLVIAGYYYPIALRAGEAVYLVARGSTWEGPGVPAALTIHARGDRVPLPDPADVSAWLCQPSGNAGGLLPILSVVRDLIWQAHWLHPGNDLIGRD